MTQPTVTLTWTEREPYGSVARIALDHQARINIVNSELIQALTEQVNSLQRVEDLRLLILTGAGERAFIGGADINEMATLDHDSARAFITRLHEACAALRELPVPVIARIHGYCLGAGLEIAAACDLRIASDEARFGMPEVQVGIPSVIEAALLPRLIGWGKTAELLYTGRLIAADEALRCGLIERVVSRAELDDALQQWVDAILRAGPQAIRLQKQLMRRWEALPLARAIEAGIAAFAEAYTTDEPQVMMQRFLERRKEAGT